MLKKILFLTTLPSLLLADDCSGYLSCDECAAARCGWCINTRRCVPDVAWQCQGEVDHIGALTGKQCPKQHELAAMRAARRAAAAAASAPAAGDAASGGEKIAAGLTWTTASPEHASDLAARAAAARNAGNEKSSRGAREPYETLLVGRDATAREVRRAYKALSARLHPDKNHGKEADASAAFADVAAAFELLSDPAAREAFDAAASGGQSFFNDEQSFAASGQTFGADLYARVPIVTELSEATFYSSFAANRVWLLIYYAPWCGHCQQAVPTVTAAAEALADNEFGVDVGAINCAKNADLCGRSDIREYPTYRLAAGGADGLTQSLPFQSADNAESIASWALDIAAEWRWLINQGNVSTISGHAAWDAFLNETKQVALVLCVDIAESGPAKTARTNLLRLAASVGSSRAAARIIDCDIEDSIGSTLCTRLGLPAPPFAPVLRVIRAGDKAAADVGEALYSPSDVEPHIALKIAETVIRLAVNGTEDGRKSTYDKGEQKMEEDADKPDEPGAHNPPPPPRPALKWAGPTSKPSTPHFGGSAPSAPRLN
jgi:curved DNA-binding protein CbpA